MFQTHGKRTRYEEGGVSRGTYYWQRNTKMSNGDRATEPWGAVEKTPESNGQ